MTLTDRQHLVAFYSVNGVGRKTILKLAQFLQENHLGWEELWQSSDSELQLAGIHEHQRSGLRQLQKIYTPASYSEALSKKHIDTLVYTDDQYPSLLKKIPDFPVVLFTQGIPRFQQKYSVGVVGTRHISPYGKLVTRQITSECVSAEATIISGFMSGVDEWSHKTAIERKGYSIGVLGYGFDYVFPGILSRLKTELLEAGNLLITEYAPHVSPRRGHFPSRNRIVAGLSQAVIITEAAEDSGSLITARQALRYQRLVAAVPGPITSVYAEGTRQLVNQGACLIRSGWEVIEKIQAQSGLPPSSSISDQKLGQGPPPLEAQTETQIYAVLKQGELTTDQLSDYLQLPTPEVSAVLSVLEMKGCISKVGDRWWIVE